MKQLLMLLSGAAVIGACAPTTSAVPPSVAAGPPPAFTLSDYAWAQAAGDAGIRGSALYSPRGAVWTCTADGVTLIPEGSYARWRVQRIWGDTERGLATATERRTREPDTPAEFAPLVRTAACDPYNRFRFDGLGAGAWYVVATMRPPAGSSAETVHLMRRVELSPGETQSVTVGWNL